MPIRRSVAYCKSIQGIHIRSALFEHIIKTGIARDAIDIGGKFESIKHIRYKRSYKIIAWKIYLLDMSCITNDTIPVACSCRRAIAVA
jgi:hypothetical protein